MKFLPNDTAEMILENRKALQKYLDFRKQNDEWIIPFCNECATVGISYFGEVDKTQTDNISEEIIREAMENKLLLVFPKEMRHQIMPVRYTAFPDICNRAGLKGRTIELMADKGNISALDPIIKSQWLSTGLSLNGNECKILIRDDKISGMKSHEYQIFPEHMLISVLEEEMASNWPEYEYTGGMVSHEFLSVNYDLNASDMEESLKLRLEDFDIKVEKIKVGVRMDTSDVGNSSVILAPYMTLDNTKIALGKSVYIRHDTSNTLDTIIEKTKLLAVSFKEAEDEIENLGNTQICFPKECFMNIVQNQKLPKKIAESIADTLAPMTDATAMDIFIALNQLVEVHFTQSKMALSSLINEQEQVAKLMYLDYTLFDKED